MSWKVSSKDPPGKGVPGPTFKDWADVVKFLTKVRPAAALRQIQITYEPEKK